MSIPREEFILNKTWQSLSEERGENFIFAHTDEVDKLFRGPSRPPSVVVSADSDAGVFLQSDYHPNMDLRVTALVGVDWDAAEGVTDRYLSVPIGPCCEIGRCRPMDKYILKMDRHAYGTFSEIPPWVRRWYTTNPGLPADEDSRVRWIPFGVNHHGEGKDVLPTYANRPKKGLLYVNFSPNCYERIRLLNHFSRISWVTVRQGVGVEQFFAEASEHKFVLSPFGNGMDCYRNLESIYLESIPIVPASDFSRHYIDAGLPVVACRDYFSLTPKILHELWAEVNGTQFDRATATLSHWRKEFEQCSVS